MCSKLQIEQEDRKCEEQVWRPSFKRRKEHVPYNSPHDLQRKEVYAEVEGSFVESEELVARPPLLPYYLV